MSAKQAYVIVVGNEKGGAGKTTSTMHLITALQNLGFKVASIDTDYRQASLTRYLENRAKTIEKDGLGITSPTHYRIEPVTHDSIAETEKLEREQLEAIIASESPLVDFIVVDTPGSNSHLSRVAHSYAGTIVTPINDSFVDLDLLALVDGNNFSIVKPGIYSQMVWEQKMERAGRDRGSVDWVVLRNRLSVTDAINKRNMENVIGQLAKRVGFRVAPGFSERVIFRELFLKGLTLLDLLDPKLKFSFTVSHVAARHELRNFLSALNIPQVNEELHKKGL